MRSDQPQASAKIYQFPLDRRRAAAGVHTRSESQSEHQAPQHVRAAVGGNWYHEAAIEDAKRDGAH